MRWVGTVWDAREKRGSDEKKLRGKKVPSTKKGAGGRDVRGEEKEISKTNTY